MARIRVEQVEYLNTAVTQAIARIVASSIRPMAQDLNITHLSYSTLHKGMQKLVNDKVLEYTRDIPRCLRFTAKGEAVLADEMPQAFAYYQEMTATPLGRNAEDKMRLRRQSYVQTLMYAGSVLLGSERPLLSKIRAGQALPLSAENAHYITAKELKFARGTKESREQLSRASGYLLSRGFSGPVYALPDQSEFLLNYRGEQAFAVLPVSLTRELTDGSFDESCWKHKAIVIVDRSNVLLKMMRQAQEKKAPPKYAKRVSLQQLLVYPETWDNTSFHFLPHSGFGAHILQLLTQYTAKEFSDAMALYRDVARDESGTLFLLENNTKYLLHEFLSCNISQLQRLKLLYSYHDANLRPLAIMCFPGQERFLRDFLEDIPFESYPIDPFVFADALAAVRNSQA